MFADKRQYIFNELAGSGQSDISYVAQTGIESSATSSLHATLKKLGYTDWP